MSINKKIVIGIVAAIIIIVFVIIGTFVYHSKNIESITDGESNTNSMQDNSITTTNEILNTDMENNIQENILEDERVEENKTNDITEQKDEASSTNNNTTEQKKQESTTQSSVKKQESQIIQTQNNKTQSAQSQQTTQTQDNKQNQETTQVKPQEEQQTTQKPTSQEQTSKEETKQEETTSKPAVEKCTNNNNHGMSVGNSGKWFNSKAEAVAEYDAEIKKWGDKWINDEISTDEYNKNCPYGHEVWTCPYCNLWTLNYYYN